MRGPFGDGKQEFWLDGANASGQLCADGAAKLELFAAARCRYRLSVACLHQDPPNRVLEQVLRRTQIIRERCVSLCKVLM